MNNTEKAIHIRKLSRTTLVIDCDESLKEWLSVNSEDLRKTRVKDFDFEIWCAVIHKKYYYAKSLTEVCKLANINMT